MDTVSFPGKISQKWWDKWEDFLLEAHKCNLSMLVSKGLAALYIVTHSWREGHAFMKVDEEGKIHGFVKSFKEGVETSDKIKDTQKMTAISKRL